MKMLMMLALCALGANVARAEVVSYRDYDAENGTFTNATAECTVVTSDTTELANGGWYAVKDTVVIDNGANITVNGSAHLILCDDSSLTVTNVSDSSPAIDVGHGAALTIYGQEDGSGTLTATGGKYCAGIGIRMNAPSIGMVLPDIDAYGAITINGGIIAATGWMRTAGICGTVTINGGTVTADGKIRGTAEINGGNIKAETISSQPRNKDGKDVYREAVELKEGTDPTKPIQIAGLENYGTHGLYPLDGNKLYLYLPIGEHTFFIGTEEVVVKIEETTTFTYSLCAPGEVEVAEMFGLKRSMAVVKGQKVEKTIAPEFSFSRFVNWVTEDGVAFDFNSPIMNDVTVYAQWDFSLDYLQAWLDKTPELIKKVLEANDFNGFGELQEYLLYETSESDDGFVKAECANALFYLAMSRICYYVCDHKDYATLSNAKSREDIIKVFLRTTVLADDFAKLIENLQAKRFSKVFLCLSEILPDFDAAIKKCVEPGADPDYPDIVFDSLQKCYVQALKKAIAENNTEPLYGEALHRHVFAGDWSYDQTKHWHVTTCGHEGVVSGFGNHAFGEKVQLGDKTVCTCTVCGYEQTDGGSVIVPEGKKLVDEDAVILREGEVAVKKESIAAPSAETVTVEDNKVQLGVAVLKTSDLTAEKKNWDKVKITKDNIDVDADGNIIVNVPVDSASGFMILQSKDAKISPAN